LNDGAVGDDHGDIGHTACALAQPPYQSPRWNRLTIDARWACVSTKFSKAARSAGPKMRLSNLPRASNRATGYYWAGAAFVQALHQNGLLSLGSGALLSTVGDLLRWDAALYTDTLLKRGSRDEMFTPVRNNYGYGWEIRRVLDRPSTTHSGSQFGYSTYIMRLPAERVTVIVLSNSDRTSATRVTNALAAITFGSPYKTPEPQLFDILGTTIKQRGVEAGVAQYLELKRTLPNRYDFGEEMLNELGYDLLGVGKVSDAVGVFTLAVEMFPTSSNLYDSLGEANMLRGEDALAIRNYERSLELDAVNVNAVGRLAKLRARTAKPRGAGAQ